jgi:ABC-2 type transport system ATP-binding protein
MTILLTTHYMDEAEELSDYVYIVDAGKIVKEGKPKDLIGELGNDTIRIVGNGNAETFASKLRHQSYTQKLDVSGTDTMHIGVDSGQNRVPDILSLASDYGFAVHEVEIDRPDLGDVFFSATGREMRE